MAAEESCELFDRGSRAVDRLRFGESWWAGQARKFAANERERLSGQILGQVGRVCRGLGEVPSMREEIGEADLQYLRAGAVAKRPGITPLEHSRMSEGVAQHGRRRTVGPRRVVTEVICSALGHGTGLDQGGEHLIALNHVINQVPYAPLGARRCSRPLVCADPGDQFADHLTRTLETFDRRRWP